jgi:hypothetical protein
MFDKEDLVEATSKPKQKERTGLDVFKPLLFETALGVFSIIASFVSIYLATFLGVTNQSLFNASMLLLLTILITILLLIRSINHLFNQRRDLFLMGIIIFGINILVLVWKIIEFISIPLP